MVGAIRRAAVVRRPLVRLPNDFFLQPLCLDLGHVATRKMPYPHSASCPLYSQGSLIQTSLVYSLQEVLVRVVDRLSLGGVRCALRLPGLKLGLVLGGALSLIHI